MTNAARLASKHPAIVYTDDELFEGLRTELSRYRQSGGTFKALSERCGGYPTSTTIGRVACGDSASPRTETVIRLFIALGFRIQAISVGNR